jgi:hypothetical protein
MRARCGFGRETASSYNETNGSPSRSGRLTMSAPMNLIEATGLPEPRERELGTVKK